MTFPPVNWNRLTIPPWIQIGAKKIQVMALREFP